jgi:hypothetical protein
MQRKPKQLLWPRPLPSRGEMLAILAGVVFLVIVLVAMVEFPTLGRPTNAGFGPDWECTSVPHSEQVCVRKAAPPPR